MRRLLAFIPPIAAAALYAYIGITAGFKTISPLWLVGIGLLFAAALMLSFFKRIGAIFGIAVAAALIYMGTQETGQIINEAVIGVILGGFYGIMALFSKKKE